MSTGRPRVKARNAYGRKRHVGVHQLVCLAFHGEPPTLGHQACHWDDDPRNNRPSNLRWATAGENYADAVRNGRRPSIRP